MTPRIQGKPVTDEDHGRLVAYRDPGSRRVEQGILSSHRDDGSVFVRFRGDTAQRCAPERLAWVVEDAEEKKVAK